MEFRSTHVDVRGTRVEVQEDIYVPPDSMYALATRPLSDAEQQEYQSLPETGRERFQFLAMRGRIFAAPNVFARLADYTGALA